MLTFLRISGFALIETLELELRSGMTVVTGETGAGKSIVVQALGLLRGGRASTEVIRGGADEAQVEALFSLSPDDDRLRALAADGRLGSQEAREGTLLVRRVVARNGRGRVYLGGALATAAELADAVGGLVDITSQHDQQSLMDADSQLAIVDVFANNQPLLDEMRASYSALSEARRAFEAFDTDARGRAEREDFLRFQLRELDEAAMAPGEDEALRMERERARSSEKLNNATSRSEEVLYSGEDAAATRIAEAVGALEPLIAVAPTFAGMVERLRDARALVEDVARELGRESGHAALEPGRLEEIEDRLYLISRLTRKHGGTIESALAHQKALAGELAALGNFDDALEAKKRTVEESLAAAQSVAKKLSRRRHNAAEQLSPAIGETLAELGLAGARLTVKVEPRADAAALGREGYDRVWFEFAPNPGEPPGPLARIASGGELSRVMLAIKRALAHADRATTYVFDEIDTGVGGQVADGIGRKLAAVAESRQVLVVTHLPQIAAFAQHHLKVEKQVNSGRTSVTVRNLSIDERRDELARMLGGSEPSKEATAHAEQLLRVHADRKENKTGEATRVPRTSSTLRSPSVPSERRTRSRTSRQS